MTTFGTCKGCGSRRSVPDEGTTEILRGDDIAFVRVATPCLTCKEDRVRIDMRQFDEQPTGPDRA